MQAEIISIGDEITSGQLLDTNSQWLSQRLEERGIRVLYHTTVGDELEPNVDVFGQAIQRADLVIATGGLGPTADDLTREALAQAIGVPLQLDPEALEYINALFVRRNRPMPEQNKLQAMFPAGSTVVKNPNGTAPGIDMEIPREGRMPCRVICLPGVPAEMVEMWNDSVETIVDGLANGLNRRVIRRRLIHCFGAGESQIESMLPDLIRRGRRPTVGITASKATITLRIAADGETEQECLAAIEPTVATIYRCLGSLVFGEGDDTLQQVVVRLLREREKTLATAECGTAGLVAEWFGEVTDARSVYRGGLVVTAPADDVETMAANCRQQFDADFGLAIGPFPGNGVQDGVAQPVVLALSSSEGIELKTIPFGIHPALTRIYYAKHALNLLRLVLPREQRK